MANMAVTKERFMKELSNQYSLKNVIDEGKTIRLEVPTKDTASREAIAYALSIKYKGRLKVKKTEVAFAGYSLEVKPQGVRSGTPKPGGTVYYGLLTKLPLKTMDLSALRSIDSSLVNGTLPRSLKESSDVIGVSQFNRELEKISKTTNGADISIGKFSVSNAVGVVAIVGKEPKADFVVLQKNGNALIPALYISYKKGTSAKDFQNYSGLSEKTSKLIWTHVETKKFFKKLSAMYESKVQEEVKQEITDTDIVFQSIFGQDYGGKYGLDNVNIVAQGTVSISPNGVVSYDHIIENGKKIERTSGYYPVFGARAATGRGAVTPSGERVEGFRIGIFPRAYRSKWMIV
jgi:hypothetical protein